MIYIVYTTQTKKQQKFKLTIGNADFDAALRKSSRARYVYSTKNFSPYPVSVADLIKGGVDIKFEASTPVDKAIVKLLPYDKSMFDLSLIYRDLIRLEEDRPRVYAFIKMNLLANKYHDIYEMYDDIRDQYKQAAVDKVSLYQAIEGRYCLICHGLPNAVPQEILYDNIELISAAVHDKYGVLIMEGQYIGHGNQADDIIVAEYYADIVEKVPYIRKDVYLAKPFTDEEMDELKEANRSNLLDICICLPEGDDVIIRLKDSVLTADEMNQKYFNK